MSDGPGNIAQLTAQQETITSVTSAQLLALDVTPISLVPAAGAGTVVIVDEIIYEYTFVSVAYTAGSIGGIFYGTPVGFSNSAGQFDAALTTNTSSCLKVAPATMLASVYPRTTVENQPILYGAPSATGYGPYVGGDGTMIVTVVYRVLTL